MTEYAPFIAVGLGALIGFLIGRHAGKAEAESFMPELEKLDIKPGDTFVVRYDHFLSQDQRAALKAHLFRHFGSDRSITPIVLEDGMRIEVVPKAERTEQA